MGMPHRQLPRQGLEAGGSHFVEVPHGAIDDRSHAADRPHHGGVHLADARAEGVRPIGVEITDPGQFDPDKFFGLLATLGQTAIGRDELRPLVAA